MGICQGVQCGHPIRTMICAQTGNIYAGLIYPIIIALMTFVIGSLFLRETRHVRIWDELLHHTPEEGARLTGDSTP